MNTNSDKKTNEDSDKDRNTTIRFSIREPSDPNLTAYSAATIMNSVSDADTTESETIAVKRQRHRRGKRDSIMVSVDPSQHVMFLLGENDSENPESNASHKIFCELDELYDSSGVGDFEWKECARWIKFEEDVEENGERWSKPHVATLSLFSLFQVRNFLDQAVILLNLDALTMEQIAATLVDQFINENKLDLNFRERTEELLLKRHTHLHNRMKHKMGRTGTSTGLPLIRSLADIGKKHSSRDVEKG